MPDRENKLIRKIKQSLSKLDEGTFGICDVCGEEISINRLKARPVATYCISCKSKMEIMEKAAGVEFLHEGQPQNTAAGENGNGGSF